MTPKYDADGEEVPTEEEEYLMDIYGLGYSVVSEPIGEKYQFLDTDPDKPGAANLTDNLEIDELMSDLASAINSLPMSLGEVMRLRYVYDLSQQDVADNLGIDQATVSRRETAAIEMIRNKLADHL